MTPVTARSPTGMHGLNSASRTAGRSLLCSPQALLGARSSPLRSTSASCSGRSRRLESTFRSPAKTIRFRTISTRSTFLAEFFDLPTGLSSDSFDRRLPPSRRFNGAGRIATGDPLPDSLPATQPLSRLSAPLWGFRPRRLTALKRFHDRELTVMVRPISLRSPPASSFITSANGSSFQVRYVPSGSLFREPLGTTTIVHRNGF